MTAGAPAVEVPAGHRLVSLAERPDLIDSSDIHNTVVWPEFMLHFVVANRLFGRSIRDWPEMQFVLLDEHDQIIATNNCMPLMWDGSDEDLPEGWDDQVERSVRHHDARREMNTLGAMQIVVAPGARGGGHAATMVRAMRATAESAGYRALIACVRPTLKERYPLVPIERYAEWRRKDGLPFDPWIRVHARLGARIVRAAPRSMKLRGSVADWERWTGLHFPDSGQYVIDGATQPVTIDRARDEGVYFDQNVWMVHEL